GPKNRPHRPPRPQGNPPPTNGVATPPRHQLPHLPYICSLLCLSKVSRFQSFRKLLDSLREKLSFAQRHSGLKLEPLTSNLEPRTSNLEPRNLKLETHIFIRSVLNYIFRYN